jgi:hypothetical protein
MARFLADYLDQVAVQRVGKNGKDTKDLYSANKVF